LSISSSLRVALGRTELTDHRHRRLVSIVQGVVTGLASRVVGIVISLLSVPLTIGYLGPERYGVWILLSSLLAWVRLADLGIGSGLTSAIAAALGSERPDLVRAHVSTAFALLSAISVVLGLFVVLVWPWIDWNGIFGINAEDARLETPPAVAASISIFLLAFPLSVVGTSYNAVQEGRLANYWGMAGNVASLLALIVVTHTRGGLVWLVLAVSGAGLVMNILSGVWFFTRCKPGMAPQIRAIQRESIRGLMQIGIPFFLIQIMALVVFQTDNLIIGHFLGAAQVPSYSLTYNLFGYTSIVQSVGFSYFWVAYTDAIVRRDIDWVRRTFRLNLALSLGFTLAAVVPLIFIARPFVSMWTGGAVIPSLDLVLWIAAWSMINALCSPIASLLAAGSQMKAQLIYGAAAMVTNVFLSIYLVKLWGVTGTIAATVMAYAIFVCIPTIVDSELLLRRLRLRGERQNEQTQGI
jgi:O-antigen/teichoic acid export membrane protein